MYHTSLFRLFTRSLTILLLIRCILLTGTVQAQSTQWAGIVTDSDGTPLEGATVRVVGHQGMGMLTDHEGRFTIVWQEVSATDSICVSFVGKESQTIHLGTKQFIRVVLQDKVSTVSDLVVTGLYRREKSSFTGSATRYSGKELRRIGRKNLIESLKSMEPSLNVVTNTLRGSDPNTLPDLEIRGKTGIIGIYSSESDISPNRPLFILDGMEVSLEEILKLPMDRIAGVTVLKDAASAAIYGAKSANGVIVVESVLPKEGKLRVSYNVSLALSLPDLSDYNLMNAKEKLEYERLAGRYRAKGPYEDQDALDELYYRRLSEVRRGVDTYWLSQPLRTALSPSHYLYLDGGSGEMLYGVGLSYGGERGVMKGSMRDNMGANLMLRYRTSRFILSNDLSIDRGNANHEPVPFNLFARANPYYRMTDEGGEPTPLLEPLEVSGTPIYNPLYIYTIPVSHTTRDFSVRDNFDFLWRIYHTLQMRGRIAMTRSVAKDEAYRSPLHPDFIGMDRKGSYHYLSSEALRYQADLTLSYGKLWREFHRIHLLGGWSAMDRSLRESGYDVSGFVNDLHRSPNFAQGFAEGDKPIYRHQPSRSMSFFLNANYSFKQRYLLDAGIRLDGSSLFGRKRTFTDTWTVGIGWNIHLEPWMHLPHVSLLKLRASVGNPGSQNFDAYLSTGTYRYITRRSNPYGDGVLIDRFANDELEWQKTLDHNIGADLSMWDRRVRLTVDCYYKVTDPLLVRIPRPSSIGREEVYTNLGGQVSQGLNAQLSIDALKGNEYLLNLHGTYHHGSSKYREIGKSLDFMNRKEPETSLRRYYEGGSPDDMWAVPSLGIDPATGREVFLRRNGSHTFTYDVRDAVVVGSSAPKAEGIAGFTVVYKRLSLHANLRYRIGGKAFATALHSKVENITEEEMYYNVDRRALYDRWKQPGDRAKFKAIDQFDSTPLSSRFIIDDSSLSGESMSISYDSSPKALKRWGIEGISASFYANDLFRLSHYRNERGIEYPYARSFTLSLGIRM